MIKLIKRHFRKEIKREIGDKIEKRIKEIERLSELRGKDASLYAVINLKGLKKDLDMK